MKAYQVVEPGKPLELNEFDAPKPQGEEILIKTIASNALSKSRE